MLGTLAGIIGSGTAMSYGSAYGTAEGAWMVLILLCAVFVPLCVGGLMAERKNTGLLENLHTKESKLLDIAQKYNAVTELLEDSYRDEKRGLSSSKKEMLRRQYEQKYLQNKQNYEQEKELFLTAFEADTPESNKMKRYWKWVITLGVIAQLSACGYSIGSLSESVPETTTLMEETNEVIYWNAENIPMPHLQDASRWVSNPDGVVSENTEALLNQWLCKLNDSLGIETVMILVNHIENDDPFRLAQDVGNAYGVGKDNRGLMVVLGYEDHSINISPGRSLEADLTDVECRRLQQEYVIPSMKAELPDSGMLYLAEAIYNLLQKKQLPEMSYLTNNEAAADEDIDMVGLFIMIYMFLFGGWATLIAYLAHRYNGRMFTNWFKANPFAAQPEVIVTHGGGFGGGHFGGGSFGGGGGFSGGSFGGGSFGGGGATSRW